MSVTLTQLCEELNNWFEPSPPTRVYDTFVISGGKLDLSELVSSGVIQTNQYFRLVDSVFNDGVYKYTPHLTLESDETFDGSIWPMRVPPAIIELLDDINNWVDTYGSGEAVLGPLQSESVGSYSYTKRGTSSGGGDPSDMWSWQNHYKVRLNRWRKIRSVR